MIVCISISIVIVISYIILISFFLYGYTKINEYKTENSCIDTFFVSIVIAAKNEEKNIAFLLNDLCSQSYNKKNYEVILVDDNSTDSTKRIIQQFIKTVQNIKLVELTSKQSGKKQAIYEGIQKSKADLLICTDADCRVGTDWIKTVVSFYLQNKPQLIIAPVELQGNSLFQQIQQLEFFSLMASTAGAAGINRPIMCNGANLAFEKIHYLNCVHKLHYEIASGDDIFLLLALKKNNKAQIRYLKSAKATVYTNAKIRFKDFIKQRMRWVSKSKAYNDSDIIIVSLIVFMINSFLFLLLIMTFFISDFIYFIIIILVLKSIPDFLILYKITSDSKKINLLKWFLPLQFIYFIYIAFITILGLLKKYQWK